MIKNLVALMRPKQWIKNLFVFLPMFFGGALLRPECWLAAGCAFLLFSLAASSIYCLNDIIDAPADALHPRKRFRPILPKVSPRAAMTLSAILALTAVIASFFIPETPGPLLCPDHTAMIERWLAAPAIILAYIFLNVCYCIGLKHVSIVDVMMVSFGFVLRILLGGVVCDIPLSPWIVVMVFLLALFIAFAKRRDDLVIAREKGISPRRSSMEYNIPFLNQTLAILGAVMMVGYLMYCLNPATTEQFHSQYIYVTAIFVLAALLRYLQITLVEAKSGSPTEIIYSDRFLQLSILLWLLTFFLLIYL